MKNDHAKIAVLFINACLIVYIVTIAATKGFDALGSNYIFLGYLIFSTLTLPFFISKTIFGKKFAGITTALSFLYFPLQVLLLWTISTLFGVSLDLLLPAGVFFNLVFWNILLFLFSTRNDTVEGSPKDLLDGLVPAILFSLFLFQFIRQQDSVVAIDYLQHITVPNALLHNNDLCWLPGHCSNLFLQHGYTTFYHSILGNIAVFLKSDLAKTFYVLDLVFPLIASIPIYSLFKKLTGSTFWSQLGVLLSLLVFVMGGFDFSFFIPQTLALLLFLLILNENRLDAKRLILASFLLFATHFIIGTMFAVYLWVKASLIDPIETKAEKRGAVLILLSFVAFTILVSATGFSIEKTLQLSDVQIIGGITNFAFPSNISELWDVLGSGWIYYFLAILGIVANLPKSKNMLAPLAFMSLGIGLYFLAPTYANKFTLGLGVFSSVIIIQFLSQLNLKIVAKTLISLALVTIFGINFIIQYKRYLTFYTQENGIVSVFTKEDKYIVDYLNRYPANSFIVSDPYTQLILTSLTQTDTANAQYMSLETRANLQEYLINPNNQTYYDLATSPGMPSSLNFDILYTSRLYRSLVRGDTAWLYNLYSLDINNTEKIVSVDNALVRDQEGRDKCPMYIDDHFVLFTSCR